MYGVEVVVRTTRFYEGFTKEAEEGDRHAPQLELKFREDIATWLRQIAQRDGYHFEGVVERLQYHWHAYERAKEGTPVALKFWFGDPAIAALFKLTWDGV